MADNSNIAIGAYGLCGDEIAAADATYQAAVSAAQSAFDSNSGVVSATATLNAALADALAAKNAAIEAAHSLFASILKEDAPPSQSPRDVLASAIVRHVEAKARFDETSAIVDGLWERRSAARLNVATADAALVLAQDDLASGNEVAEIGGHAALNLRTARDVLSDAKAILEAVEKSEPKLKADVEDARSRLSFAELLLANAVCNVIKSSPRVQQVIADFWVARRTYVEMYRTMRFLAGAGGLPSEAGNWDVSIEFDKALGLPLPEWVAALEALRADACASLPE